MKPFLASLVVLVTLSTAWGCHETELQVQLPPNFSGNVVLDCADASSPNPTATSVDSAGHGTGAPCSDPSTRIVLIRNNQRLSPPEIRWLKAGDGLPTGLEFTVR